MRYNIILAVCIFGFCAPTLVTGWKGIGELCSHWENRPDSCNPSMFLVCGERSRCECRQDMTWVRFYGRCTYKIDAVCNSGNQGSNLPGCPPNAFCHHSTTLCKCMDSFFPTRDRTGCTNGAFTFHGSSSRVFTFMPVAVALWTVSKRMML